MSRRHKDKNRNRRDTVKFTEKDFLPTTRE